MSKPEQISAAEDNVAFLGNPEKKKRERWVAEHWCRATEHDPSALLDSKEPDFQLDGQGIEVTEVQSPNRRRHSEFKRVLADVKAGKRAAPWDGLDLEKVQNAAHDWIFNAIENKAKHYVKSASSWRLIVYVNLTFCDQIRWDLVRDRIKAAQFSFAEVHALYADGSQSKQLFP